MRGWSAKFGRQETGVLSRSGEKKLGRQLRGLGWLKMPYALQFVHLYNCAQFIGMNLIFFSITGYRSRY